MTKPSRASGIRAAALTRDQIVGAAIVRLDAGGEGGLTFRNLARDLQTGHGAIQWHVATRAELLAAAAATALGRALTASAPGVPPREALHAVGLDVFDAIDAHPWLGRQLSTAPWEPAMVRLWEAVGRPVEQLGIPESALFTAVSTVVSFIIGTGSQNAANAHDVAPGRDRSDVLDAVADHWESLDPLESPFVHRVAGQLRVHDDRDEFLAGLDIIISGLVTLR